MNIVCKFLSFLAAMVLLGSTAQAQVVGDWETNLGDLRIFRDRTGVSIHPDYNMSASGARREVGPLAFVVMHGKYEHLRFKGDWWIMGRPRESTPPRRCTGTRPPLYTSADDTREYGQFIVTFNAAENSFTGTVQWHCRQSDGRTREGPLETFTGTRKGSNIQVYRPVNPVPVQTIDPNPNPGGTPPAAGGRNAREQREWDYRQCTNQLDLFRLNIASSGSARQQVRFVRDFQIRPCEIDAATLEKFQIDMLSPPAEKRPSSLILRSVQIEGSPTRDTDVTFNVPLRFLPTTITKPLPFSGVPRAGSAIMNQIMPGNFCNAVYWLAYMRYSDGSESPPFSLLTSSCGMRRHPEQVPSGSASGDGPRPVGRDELKPAKPRS